MKNKKKEKLSCLRLTKIQPQDHQKNVAKFLMNNNRRGLIIFHSVGSGKTLTSLITAKCLLSKYPNKNIIITTKVSLIDNFENEMKRINLDRDNVKIYSHNILINRLKEFNDICSNNILIIDEAHNFLSNTGANSKYIINCAKRAYKVLLLTATPVRNKPDEISNLLCMITGEDIKKVRNDVRMAMIDDDKFKDIFECKVSIINNQKDKVNYPSSKEYIIKLKMSEKYYKEYYKIQEGIRSDLPEIFEKTSNLTVFFNGIRRGVNKLNIISPKIEWSIKRINEDIKKNKKILIYSTWKDAGINILKDYMNENDIKYSEVSGSLIKETRDKLVNEFNKGDTNVILITSAGAEGLNLKGTRTIIILEPYWNYTRIEQVIGRGIRYGSHKHLPKKKRHVDIYHLILEKPNKVFMSDNMKSADTILNDMSMLKKMEIEGFYKKLNKLSIESNKRCKSKEI